MTLPHIDRELEFKLHEPCAYESKGSSDFRVLAARFWLVMGISTCAFRRLNPRLQTSAALDRPSKTFG